MLQPVVALATERLVGGDLLVPSRFGAGAGSEEEAFERLLEQPKAAYDAVRDRLLLAFELADRWQGLAWLSVGLPLGALGSGQALMNELSGSVADLDALRRRVGRRLLIRCSAEGALAAAHSPLLDQLRQHQGLAIELRLQGRATLAQLLQLSFERFVLPTSLVQGIDGDGHRQRFVRWLVAGCQRIGVEVCAPGVDSRSQATWLRQNGVDLASGPLWGTALAQEDFELLLRQGRGTDPDAAVSAASG